MKFQIQRSWLILGLALGVGALAAFGMNRYITRQVQDLEARSKSGKMVRVVVPKEDLPKGAGLTADVVATRDVPVEWVHSNAIKPEQFGRVENSKLAYPARGGEMLLWSMLDGQHTASFSSHLPAGHRAVTVPVDEVNSISGMLAPQDRIDLMVSVRKDGRQLMFPLMQNVAVLATGTRVVSDSDAKDGRRSFTTITLDASPQDAQRVLAAREVGKLAAVLRAPGDNSVDSSTRRDTMSILGIAEDSSEGTGVPVIYGGTSGLRAGQTPGLQPARAGAAPPTDGAMK